jgi:hypothetical protein
LIDHLPLLTLSETTITTNMAESWSPPKDGTPCWINVLATDVQRGKHRRHMLIVLTTRSNECPLLVAKAFYSEVFNWSFNRTTTSEGQPLDPAEIAMFEVPGQPSPNGGITRVSASEWASSHGKGGVVLYLYVDDINPYEQVSHRPLCSRVL